MEGDVPKLNPTLEPPTTSDSSTGKSVVVSRREFSVEEEPPQITKKDLAKFREDYQIPDSVVMSRATRGE